MEVFLDKYLEHKSSVRLLAVIDKLDDGRSRVVEVSIYVGTDYTGDSWFFEDKGLWSEKSLNKREPYEPDEHEASVAFVWRNATYWLRKKILDQALTRPLNRSEYNFLLNSGLRNE